MAQTFEGDVDFTVHGKLVPHRFEVSVTDENRIGIWIEDRQSKKQWHTNALETKDFVTVDNIIPRARAVDYAERFAECMGSPDGSSKYGRTLTIKGSERTLALSLPFQWATLELAVEYQFLLREVPLERIDIISARMRDIEDKVASMGADQLAQIKSELGALKAEIDDLKQRTPERETKTMDTPIVYAQATTLNSQAANSLLEWTLRDSDSGGAIETLPTGHIRFTMAGVYALEIGVVHNNAKSGEIFELKKADVTLAAGLGNSDSNYMATTPLHYILKAQANDEVCVIYTADGYACAGSYMTIVKL